MFMPVSYVTPYPQISPFVNVIPVPVTYYGLLVREQHRRALREQQRQHDAYMQQMHYNQAAQAQYAAQQAAAQVAAFMPLPLQAVHVSAQVFDFCAEVTVTQTYTNQSPFVLESEYIFPLDENSAVCGFKAEINGRIINGLVKEKEEAKREFNQAKAQGKSTMLLEQKQENVFKISIGNLEGNSTCKITLTYITTLDLEGKSNKMVIPAVVAPKYEPKDYWGWNGFGYSGRNQSSMSGFNGAATVTAKVDTPSTYGNQLGFFQSMTAQYMGAPLVTVPVVVPIVPQVQASDVTVSVKQQRAEPQRFSMSIDLLMPSEILSITSETHQDKIQVQVDPVVQQPSFGSSGSNPEKLPVPQKAKVLFGMNFDGSAPAMWPESLGSKDFILTITQKVYLETRAVLEVDPQTGSQAVQLAFCPQTMDLLDASALQTEILFLIDQSGSMGGSPIQAVKSCLEIFLKSLPVACKFNIISFGDSYRKLFPTSQFYTEQSITQAMQYVHAIDANLGGTEILQPLRYCFESSGDVTYPRQIFLLTDGQVSNTQELVDLTRKWNHTTRLFSFGLGSSVDRHLVKSLAQAGGGYSEFIVDVSTPQSKSELNGKIMRNLVRAMQPALTDIKIQWAGLQQKSGIASSMMDFFSGSNSGLQQCPSQITPIFPPNRSLIYALNTSAQQAPLVNQGAFGGAPMFQAPNNSNGESILQIKISAQSNRPLLNGSSQNKVAGRVEFFVPLNISRPQYGSFIHKLAARSRISELQNASTGGWGQNTNKQEILKLALKYQLLSNYTSFIIVDDRKIKKAKKPKQPKPSPVLMNAQVNMFNAFMSQQHNPGMPVNQNGYAFTSTNGGNVVHPKPQGFTFGAVQPQPQQVESDESGSDEEEEAGQYYDNDPFASFGSASSVSMRQSSSNSNSFSHNSFGAARFQRSHALNGMVPGAPPSASSSSSSAFAFGAPPAPQYQQQQHQSYGFGGGLDFFGGMPSGGGGGPAPRVKASKKGGSSERSRRSEMNCDLICLPDDDDFGDSFASAAPASAQAAPFDFFGSMNSSSTSSAFGAPAAPPAAAASFSGFGFGTTPVAPTPTSTFGFGSPVSGSVTSGTSATSSSSSSSSLDTLFLVLLQMNGVDGAWNLTPELIGLMQQIVKGSAATAGIAPQIQSVVASWDINYLTQMSKVLNLSLKAVASLLALWVLETCYSQRQMEWMIVGSKARGALRNNHGVPVEKMQELTQNMLASA